VIVGAHLDSTPSTVAINDNGSGSAAILEIAEVYAAQDRDPRNKLRFIWFAAEEFGLVGSDFYVDSLDPAELAQIRAYLNFDMLGSPNYVRFVYDGDNSTFPAGPGVQAGPPGSGAIEQMWLDYFAAAGLATDPTPLSGNSDYGPFVGAGVPIGGLFTGAGALKTAAQAATYGGTAGAPYDACNHLACDDFSNQNLDALDQMSDAAAHTILLLSKRNFLSNPLIAEAAVSAHRVVTSGSTTGGGEPAPAMADPGETR
jgi:Zn-dependent M28 family amino/carboxypeptidase